MITYAQYMADSANLHNDYYAQFVTPSLVELVREYYGPQIVACEGDSFNNVPLYEKDRIAALMTAGGYFKLKLWQQGKAKKGYLPSQATLVCIVCAAMRQAREDMKKPEVSTNFRRVVFIGCGPSGNIFCRVAVKPHETKGGATLSITGVEGPYGNGDCKGCSGQIDGVVASYVKAESIEYADGWNTEQAKKFLSIWELWHLNDLTAGSPAQLAFSRQAKANGTWPADFTEKLRMLEEAGLQPDASYLHDGKPYSYGSAWLLEEIPADMLEWLFNLPESAVRPAWV